MKVKRTKPIIEVKRKELNALHIVIKLLDDLDDENDIRANFMGDGYNQLQELIAGLGDVMDFFGDEEQEDFIINVVNEEEN